MENLKFHLKMPELMTTKISVGNSHVKRQFQAKYVKIQKNSMADGFQLENSYAVIPRCVEQLG